MLKLTVLFCLVATAFAGSVRIGKPRIDGRLYGGTVTDIESHPYQVSLQVDGKHKCGGAIISENYVLSTARCSTYSDSVSGFTIRAGSSTRDSGGEVYSVFRVVRHPQFYQSISTHYDFALFQISGSFSLGSSQAIVALPESDEEFDYADAVVTGWDAFYEGSNVPIPTDLRMINVGIFLRSHCDEKYRGYTDSSMICAAPNWNLINCIDNYGGPMVTVKGDKLVGLASWGLGMMNGWPCVFARVAAVRDWITANSGV